MTFTVAPNPYSPYATARSGLRHIFDLFPVEGALLPTLCGRLAVVPPVVTLIERPGEAADAPGVCPTCIAVAMGRPVADRGVQRTRCQDCTAWTAQGEWCAPCRQSLHRQWRERETGS